MALLSRWPAVLMAALVLAALALVGVEYRGKVLKAHRVLEIRGETVLESLAAGLRAQTRMGRYRGDRLNDTLEELASMPDLLTLYLADARGTPVASAGDPLPPGLDNGPEREWQADRLILRGQFVFTGRGAAQMGGPGWRGGRGPRMDPDATPWDAAPHTLVAVLDAAQTRGEVRRARIEAALSAAGLLALFVLGMAVLSVRGRQRRMAVELERSRERAAHHERLAQLGAGLAHETKNPLGLVRGLAQSIADAGDARAETRRHARQIVDEADRIVGQVNAFLAFARPPEPALEDVALETVFGGLQALVQHEAAQAGVSLRAAANGLVVRADPVLLRRALLNLLINALRACERGGEIVMEAGWRAGGVAVCVRDNGRGIAAEDLPRVKDPYFTRFPGGTGLGLAIVDQVAAAHGWSLHVESEAGAGTRVTLEGITPAGAAP